MTHKMRERMEVFPLPDAPMRRTCKPWFFQHDRSVENEDWGERRTFFFIFDDNGIEFVARAALLPPSAPALHLIAARSRCHRPGRQLRATDSWLWLFRWGVYTLFLRNTVAGQDRGLHMIFPTHSPRYISAGQYTSGTCRSVRISFALLTHMGTGRWTRQYWRSAWRD